MNLEPAMPASNPAHTSSGSRLRVAIDARYVQDYFPGIGRYTYNLIAALTALPDGPRLTLIYNPTLPDRRYNLPELVAQHPDRLTLLPTTARPFSIGEQWQLIGPAWRGKFDLWHAPYYIRPYLLPVQSLLTAYDVTAARLPEILPTRKAQRLFGLTTRLAFLTSRRIIAISESAARDISQFYKINPARLDITPLGVSSEFQPLSPPDKAAARLKLGLPERYLLYIGINKPHKNLSRLLQAYWFYRTQTGDDLPLILAGQQDPRYAAPLHQTVRELNLTGAVQFWGTVAEADLSALYACASLFVFPSLYEGFGLPVLEAMACGTPVACANNSSLPEVAGTATVLFQAKDVEGIATAIREGLRRADELSRLGLVQAANFSWERTARQTLAVYWQMSKRNGRIKSMREADK